MKSVISALFLAASLSAQAPVKVTKIAAPEKALLFEVQLPASQDAVWSAFTTSEGLSTWLTPGAVVDLRNGGEWTAHFPGGGTGGGTILSFTAKRTLVMSAMAPPMFPHVRAERTIATWEFIPVDANTTQLTLKQTGWKKGEEWDKAYDYLAAGNAQLLETLQRRFEKGPIDWAKEWGTGSK
ncbi:MAG TPA: SRPBCC domain-containing protein [Bryobacteraceae bacterium]|jgi:uncharacterized protein YndB with AHSA1/START domain|nr:SRPBCC domain-containing protein [Bryobacteraceae bacterium]